MPHFPLAIFVALLAVMPLAWSQQAAPATPSLQEEGIAQPPDVHRARGAITRFTRAATGGIDGFVLDNGTTVHFPTYLAARVEDLLGDAREVEVHGILVRGTDRNAVTVLEARSITNSASRRTLTVTAATGGVPGLDAEAESAPVDR